MESWEIKHLWHMFDTNCMDPNVKNVHTLPKNSRCDKSVFNHDVFKCDLRLVYPQSLSWKGVT